MRLLTYRSGTTTRIAAAVDGDWAVDLASAVPDADRRIGPSPDARTVLAAGADGLAAVGDAIAWARQRLAAGARDPALLERRTLTLGPPLPADATIIATGRNFGAHLAEVAAARRRRGEREIVVDRPQAFVKLGRCGVGDGATVAYPADTTELDYEGEVVVVIGRAARDVPPERAMEHVAGYTILNDLSARDIQRTETAAGLLLLGKNLPDSAPMGPELVLADEVPNPESLALRTTVNGELRQQGTLAEMHYGWPELIAYWSRIGLRPGDAIASGTPSGVAMGRDDDAWYLRPGDRVEVEVEHLGTLRTSIGPR